MTAGLPLSGRPGDFFLEGQAKASKRKTVLTELSEHYSGVLALALWLAGRGGWPEGQGGRAGDADVEKLTSAWWLAGRDGWPGYAKGLPLPCRRGARSFQRHKSGGRRHPRPVTGHAGAWPVGPTGAFPFDRVSLLTGSRKSAYLRACRSKRPLQ